LRAGVPLALYIVATWPRDNVSLIFPRICHYRIQ
jgi:hypothetical protein